MPIRIDHLKDAETRLKVKTRAGYNVLRSRAYSPDDGDLPALLLYAPDEDGEAHGAACSAVSKV